MGERERPGTPPTFVPKMRYLGTKPMPYRERMDRLRHALRQHARVKRHPNKRAGPDRTHEAKAEEVNRLTPAGHNQQRHNATAASALSNTTAAGSQVLAPDQGPPIGDCSEIGSQASYRIGVNAVLVGVDPVAVTGGAPKSRRSKWSRPRTLIAPHTGATRRIHDREGGWMHTTEQRLRFRVSRR